MARKEGAMRAGLALLCAFGLGLAAAGSAAAQTPETQVRITQLDTTRFPRVVVHISVTDAAGNPVGIDPAQLVLSENGVAVAAESIEGIGEGEPLTTVLVLDVSGSMAHAGKLRAAQDAATAYITQMRPGDRAAVLAFNTEVQVVQPITQDAASLRRAIGNLMADGDTALYDAVQSAVDLLQGHPGRKAVIVLSDGMDNQSHQTAADVLSLVEQAELSVSTIGFGDAAQAPGSLSRLNEPLLQDLAQGAGGRYGLAENAGELADLFSLYARALQSEYTLTYVTPQGLRDGVNRSLMVSLDASGAAVPEGQRRYNPGGIVPEVAQPAAWGPFFLVLAGLAALLAVPALVRRAAEIAAARRVPQPQPGPTARGRVRLGEEKPARVRLR